MADCIDREDLDEVSEKITDENQEVSPDSKDLLKEEDKFRLLNDLKEHPCLWDSSKVEYKDRDARAKALQTLSQDYKFPIANLKRLIHSVRSALSREIKKEQDGQRPKWKFYQAVAYMKEDVLRGAKVKEDREWTDEETEKLIDFYRSNEQLWNHKLPSYRDRALKDLNYQTACDILPNRKQDEIKKQWNFLKTTFNRELKREEGSKVSGSGTDAVYCSSWKFYKNMSFIQGIDEADPPTSTLEEPSSVPTARPTKKMKTELSRSMEEAKLEFFKEAINCLRDPVREPVAATPQVASEDDISHFVKSIESTLRKMSGRQLILAKKKINDVIFEVSFLMSFNFLF